MTCKSRKLRQHFRPFNQNPGRSLCRVGVDWDFTIAVDLAIAADLDDDHQETAMTHDTLMIMVAVTFTSFRWRLPPFATQLWVNLFLLLLPAEQKRSK